MHSEQLKIFDFAKDFKEGKLFYNITYIIL